MNNFIQTAYQNAVCFLWEKCPVGKRANYRQKKQGDDVQIAENHTPVGKQHLSKILLLLIYKT